MRLKSICAALLALLCCACAPAAPAASPTPPPQTLTVMAAASLTEAFTALGKVFEARNPGVKVSFSFAGSQQLAAQLAQGTAADVFASASQKCMDTAAQAGRVRAADMQALAYNRLVVILPSKNPGGVKTLKDLAAPGLKLDLADASVPAGQYALEFLERASKDAAYGADFKDRALQNVVSYEDSVRAVLTKVSLGEVDAGIVYATDLSDAAGARVVSAAIPDALNPTAVYPIAPLADSAHAALAKAFVELALSPDGQALMIKYGFLAVQ